MWESLAGCLVVIAVAWIISWVLAPEKDKEENKVDDL
jgi:hypothetical protein